MVNLFSHHIMHHTSSFQSPYELSDYINKYYSSYIYPLSTIICYDSTCAIWLFGFTSGHIMPEPSKESSDVELDKRDSDKMLVSSDCKSL